LSQRLVSDSSKKNQSNFLFPLSYSYHQKYRLQAHKELARALHLTPSLLVNSHIAARLNGYLVGVGGVEQFDKEAEQLGLTQKQIEYVRKYVKENEGGGLSC
jgi:peptide-methionine (S)-S-oxide reductase